MVCSFAEDCGPHPRAIFDSDEGWWGWLELNQRPTGYEPAALTSELHPLNPYAIIAYLRCLSYNQL